jgi:hypothetical protein
MAKSDEPFDEVGTESKFSLTCNCLNHFIALSTTGRSFLAWLLNIRWSDLFLGVVCRNSKTRGRADITKRQSVCTKNYSSAK